MASPIQWMSLSKLWEMVKERGAWSAVVPGISESCTTEKQQDKH